jgi:CheY-like chemotaxis protein
VTANVLIVEDEGLIAEDLRDQVERLGHRVTDVVASLNDALASVRRVPPDVVLMDIRLQGEGDGIDAAVEIGLDGRVPVIFLTAHSDAGTLERALLTRPTAYLVKPVRPTELAAAIRAAAERRATDEQYEAVTGHFRRLVDHATDLVFRLTRHGHLLYANPAGLRALGVADAAVRRPLADAVAPTDHGPLGAALVTAARAADVVPIRLTLHDRDGRALAVAGVLSGGAADRDQSDTSIWAILHPAAAEPTE